MVNYSLQVNNSSGVEVFNSSTKIGTLLGVYDIPQTDGYIDDANFGLGVPFWTLLVDNSASVSTPKILVSWTGSTWRLFWTWRTSGASYNSPVRMIYGVY